MMNTTMSIQYLVAVAVGALELSTQQLEEACLKQQQQEAEHCTRCYKQDIAVVAAENKMTQNMTKKQSSH